jgi:hypothetical protein
MKLLKNIFLPAFVLFLQLQTAYPQLSGWDGPHPATGEKIKSISSKFRDYVTVLKPEKTSVKLNIIWRN